MSDEEKAAEAETTETVDETEAEQPGVTPDTETPPEVEEKARRMGWRPKDEFKGDPDRWTDAETFVKRGEEIMPILKQDRDRLERKVRDLEATIADTRDYIAKADQRAYERAVKDLKQRQRQAVELGDTDAFDAIESEIAELQKDVKGEDKASPQSGADAAYASLVAEWQEENDWFGKDEAMTAYAVHYDAKLAADNLEPAVRLRRVEKAVRKEFAHKFSNPMRSAAPAVEGAGPVGTRKAGKGYSDLPADAKAMCDRFVRNGVMTRDQYVKDYAW